MNFLPIELMRRRIESSKEDSDTSYYFDLLHYGEMVTKITTLFMVANVNDDVDRNRYRFEYSLVRADGIGDYSKVLNELVTGNAATSLPSTIYEHELEQLRCKAINDTWQFRSISLLEEILNVLHIEGNAVTKKSTLLIWFHNFTVLRNKTSGHGSITSEECSSVCKQLEESIELIYNNLFVFQRPWAHLKQSLNGKYRVSDINFKSTEFDYLKKSKTERLSDGVYCFTDVPHKVSLLKSTPELSSFEFCNGGFSDNTKQYEVLDYVEDVREKVDGADYILPPQKLPDSKTSGKKSFAVTGESFSNLPCDLVDYIEREELEGELQAVLKDEERYPIVTLKGRGGIGKTSLAIHVIENIIKTSNRFDIVVWFSARDVDLFPEGPKQVQTCVLTQRDIASQYYSLIDNQSPIPKDCEIQFASQLTSNSLGKALYVFDNFETLASPVEIFEWLSTFIRLPNKVLITSRLSRNFKADYAIDVSGMTDNQCRQLINSTASRLHVDGLINDQYIQKVIDESEGHPYIIKVIMGDVAKAQRLVDVKRIVADKDHILEALFKRTYGTLSKAAKRVFLTLSSWHSTIPVIALESVLLRIEDDKLDVEDAIEELNKTSFVEIINKDGEDYVSVPLVAAIYGNKELEVSPDRWIILEDRKQLMEFGAGNGSGVLTVQKHIHRKVLAIAGRISTVEQLRQELPTLECIANKYPETWLELADLFHDYSLFEKEKEACRTYIMGCRQEERVLDVWKRLADICKETDDWDGECAALMELVSRQSIPYWIVSNIAKRFNAHYSEEDNKDDEYRRRVMFEKVIAVMNGRISEANAVDCSRLAWLYLNLQNESGALYASKKGLEIDPDNAHCRKIYDRLTTFSGWKESE